MTSVSACGSAVKAKDSSLRSRPRVLGLRISGLRFVVIGSRRIELRF